jgi:hypothetical protein
LDILHLSIFGFLRCFLLSEHLLFSIEAIPIAFLVFILGAMLYYYSHLLVKKFNFRIWIARIIIIASFALLYFASLLFFNKAQIREQYSIVILSLAASLATLEFFARRTRIRYRFLILYSIAIFSAFSIGYDVAGNDIFDRNPGHDIKVKGYWTLHGLALRSGDKGVLFFEPEANRFSFQRWENIESIEGPPKFGSFK